MKSAIDTSIGNSLRAIRLEKGLSQSALAERICQPQSRVSKLECALRPMRMWELFLLAPALDIEPEELACRICRDVIADASCWQLPYALVPKRSRKRRSTTEGTRRLTSEPSEASSRTTEEET